MIETWQSDENGEYSSDNGFARFVPNSITKKYNLSTIKPGSVQNFEGNFQSPHILFSISSRGINMNLNTRMYFEGDNLIKDPLLSLIKKGNNDINSLIAKKIDESSYIFDIFLQGKRETIFLDV